MRLKAETYQCAKDGCIEYGWTFKVNGGDDAVFDLVLGEYRSDADPATVDKHWAKTKWAADAIVAAAKGRQA